jgi:hypothetical protein
MSDIPQGFTIRVMDDSEFPALYRNVVFGFANGFRVSIHINETVSVVAGYPPRDPAYATTSPVGDVAVWSAVPEHSEMIEVGRLTPEEALVVLNRVAALPPGAVLEGVFDEVDA